MRILARFSKDGCMTKLSLRTKSYLLNFYFLRLELECYLDFPQMNVLSFPFGRKQNIISSIFLYSIVPFTPNSYCLHISENTSLLFSDFIYTAIVNVRFSKKLVYIFLRYWPKSEKYRFSFFLKKT